MSLTIRPPGQKMKTFCKSTIGLVVSPLVLFIIVRSTMTVDGYIIQEIRRHRPIIPLTTTIRRRTEQRIVSNNNNINKVAQSFSHRDSMIPPSSVSVVLFNNNNNNNNSGEPSSSSLSNFLVSDLLAILIASELIGVLHDVTSPTFAGWFAPVTNVPGTITDLFAHFSFFAVLWFVGIFISDTLTTILTTNKVLKNDTKQSSYEGVGGHQSRNKLILDGLQTGIIFTVERTLFEVLFQQQGINFNDLNNNSIMGSSCRDGYIITLVVITFRYLYKQYFSLQS